jgi:hypothetical protein
LKSQDFVEIPVILWFLARLYSMQFRNPEEELAALLAKARAEGYVDEALPERPAGFLDLLRGRGRLPG